LFDNVSMENLKLEGINLKRLVDYLEHQRENPRSNYPTSRPSSPLLALNTVALHAYMAARGLRRKCQSALIISSIKTGT
jgi:hypothetical protein